MGKIKDFFYNKNDIIVALIILAAAAFIIYWRVGDIMAYPDKLAEANAATKQETTVAASESSEPANGDVKIKIDKDDSLEDVAQLLESEGVIPSAKDFEKVLDSAKNAKKIRAGTYDIPAGSTDKQIIDIITKKL